MPNPDSQAEKPPAQDPSPEVLVQLGDNLVPKSYFQMLAQFYDQCDRKFAWVRLVQGVSVNKGDTPVLHFPHQVKLPNNQKLTSFPGPISVEGSLDLRNCKNLKSFPANGKVYESLYLNNCCALPGIPDDLFVNSGLHVDFDLLSKKHPQNLVVGSCLYVDFSRPSGIFEQENFDFNQYRQGLEEWLEETSMGVQIENVPPWFSQDLIRNFSDADLTQYPEQLNHWQIAEENVSAEFLAAAAEFVLCIVKAFRSKHKGIFTNLTMTSFQQMQAQIQIIKQKLIQVFPPHLYAALKQYLSEQKSDSLQFLI